MGLFVSYLESVTGKKLSTDAFEDKKLLKPHQAEALKNIAGKDLTIEASKDIGKAKAKAKKEIVLAKTLAKVKK